MRPKHPHAAESGVGKHTARESERVQACATGKERVTNAHSHKLAPEASPLPEPFSFLPGETIIKRSSAIEARSSRRLGRHRLPSRQSEATADGEGGGNEAVDTVSPIVPPSHVGGSKGGDISHILRGRLESIRHSR